MSQASLPYAVIDVFTDRPYGGNPLAVVLDAEGLTTDQMQLLAREFNFSETAFPLRPTEAERTAGADYHLRIFTPDVELPFAGHPSVGSAWYLAQLGRIPVGRVGQQCGVGLLPVEVTSGSATLTGGQASVSGPVDPAAALRSVGLTPADLVEGEVRIASTGLPYALLFVGEDALSRCRPDLQLLRSAFTGPHEGTSVYVVVWDAATRHARTRMFAGDIGTPEDAATGSAALALGAGLVAAGAFPDGTHTFTVEQGVDMGRPSELVVACDVASGVAKRSQVTGRSVLVAEGRIMVPPA
jgi:trans-2,3-dihydro-3-hydroxyanthranilate isomerase